MYTYSIASSLNFLLFISFTSVQCYNHNCLFSPTNFGVTFSPCLFPPSSRSQKSDIRIDSQYEIIKSQLETVLTRFSIVYVEFSVQKLSAFNSFPNLYVPKIIANLNNVTTIIPYQNCNKTAHVLIAYEYNASITNINLLKTVQKFANEANSIHTNTVTTIVLEDHDHVFAKENSVLISYLESQKLTLSEEFKYKLAAKMDIVQYCISHTMWSNIVPLFSVLDTLIFSVKGLPAISTGLLTAQRYIYYFEKCRDKIKAAGFTAEIAFLTAYPSDPNAADSYTELDLFEFSRELNAWAVFCNVTVILEEALDGKQCGNSRSTKGWWTVFENSDGEIVLEEKITKIGPIKGIGKTIREPEWTIEHQLGMLTCSVVFIVTLCSLAIHWVLFKRYRSMETSFSLANTEIREFFEGTRNNYHKFYTKDTFTLLPYDAKKYEVELGNFFYGDNNVIGSGKFGTVYKGKIQKNRETVTVAVKTLNHGSSNCIVAQRGLLSEIKVLAYLGSHRYVIKLMGAYTKDLEKGNIFVFTELCHYGSLQSILTEWRECQIDNNKISSETCSWDTSSLNSVSSKCAMDLVALSEHEMILHLNRWSYEIASGMTFLARKNVIHGDLATRNVLVNRSKKVKISDFGLSRRMESFKDYVKKQPDYLPWRWMAPESLRRLAFNEKTDIWAFGVTLWEMYSFGEIPYTVLQYGQEFPAKLENGLRLEKPKSSSDSAFAQMLTCWNLDPGERPQFMHLQSQLRERFEFDESEEEQEIISKADYVGLKEIKSDCR